MTYEVHWSPSTTRWASRFVLIFSHLREHFHFISSVVGTRTWACPMSTFIGFRSWILSSWCFSSREFWRWSSSKPFVETLHVTTKKIRFVFRFDFDREDKISFQFQDDATEETGWKLFVRSLFDHRSTSNTIRFRVHGDVFRPPRHKHLLTAFVGSGIQIFLMASIVISRFCCEETKTFRPTIFFALRSFRSGRNAFTFFSRFVGLNFLFSLRVHGVNIRYEFEVEPFRSSSVSSPVFTPVEFTKRSKVHNGNERRVS